MLNRRDVIYTYDGSFEGLMSVVFDCYSHHEYPFDICPDENMQTVLFCDSVYSATDPVKSDRVIRSIIKKISPAAFYHLYCAYLSESAGKEMKIFDFIVDGYRYGASIINRLNLDSARNLMQIAKATASEAYLYLGFIRFQKLQNNVYYGEIEPKGHVLPLVAHHFRERFSSMPFIINDLTHRECLIYNGKNTEMRYTDAPPELAHAEDETEIQALWREFYDTIAIKERRNEKCRMTMMPKRYWRCMTEFQQNLHASADSTKPIRKENKKIYLD